MRSDEVNILIYSTVTYKHKMDSEMSKKRHTALHRNTSVCDVMENPQKRSILVQLTSRDEMISQLID